MRVLCERNVLVLMGGAGTGKSTTLRLIVRFAHTILGVKMNACALTGNFAARGGGLHVDSIGGEGGTVHVDEGTRVANNIASGAGGGAHMAGGLVVFSSRAIVEDNVAAPSADATTADGAASTQPATPTALALMMMRGIRGRGGWCWSSGSTQTSGAVLAAAAAAESSETTRLWRGSCWC